jgi:N-acetylglucosaminyldiphosphoundecaprenol N-acetyl-beta-D-mannosaminyltransferase
MERLPEKQMIAGVGVSKTSYQEIVELCRQWSEQRRSASVPRARYICVASVHGVILSQDDHEVAKILNEADIVTPDGMPLVWAIRSFGWKPQQRVYGPTLMLEICCQASQTGQRIFLYGGREDTLPELIDRLVTRFPTLQIAGAYSPPFRALTPEEDEHVQRLINAADPDVIFVGISTPKQEMWMYAHRPCFPGVIMIGVGAAFDFHAGRTRQAPAWIQRNGFEWLFRLAVEPTRLWRRYLLITPRFLPLWAMQKIRSPRRAKT